MEVLVISRYSTVDELTAGAVGVLPKPYEIDQLIDLIESIIGVSGTGRFVYRVAVRKRLHLPVQTASRSPHNQRRAVMRSGEEHLLRGRSRRALHSPSQKLVEEFLVLKLEADGER